MPRPRKPGSGEPKTRSRHGCKQCKQRKIKCGEQKPTCANCEKTNQDCDYKLELNWDGRTKRKGGQQNHMSLDSFGQLIESKEESPTEPTAKPLSQPPSTSPTSTVSQMAAYSLDPSPYFFARNTGSMRTLSNETYGPSKPLKVREDGNPYPSPVDSQVEVASQAGAKRPPFMPITSYSGMPPPNQMSPRNAIANSSFVANGFKRTKTETPSAQSAQFQGAPDSGMARNTSVSSSSSLPISPGNSLMHAWSPPPSARVPQSPIASSAGSDESQPSNPRPSMMLQPDRRMSIESLISGSYSASASDAALSNRLEIPAHSTTPTTYYGVDPGYPDFDVPFNHDESALSDKALAENARPKSSHPHANLKCNFPPKIHKAFYDHPLPVRIPQELEPLPSFLKDSDMNLLYFHHFIGHTARILVPHDCSGNPFRKILPRMALSDSCLLRLMLAYSASHRAKLMKYSEPVNRISQYVEDVFSYLYMALNNDHAKITNATFTIAIMLCSLEIISPNAFSHDTQIKWYSHLDIAGDIILRRGVRAKFVDRKDEESYFLTRWFAYLDVLGCLSGGHKKLPLFGADFWADDAESADRPQGIDCFFGFTDRCLCILARIAALIEPADAEWMRYNKQHTSAKDRSKNPFALSKAVQKEADQIREDLWCSIKQPYGACTHEPNGPSPPLSPTSSTTSHVHIHHSRSNTNSTTHALELTTTNESYHWAGLIYLARRILHLPPSDPSVMTWVNIVVAGLGKIRESGTAEACMLFPMFVAGCEAMSGENREKLGQRVKNVEIAGLTQAKAARLVMESIWKRRDAGDKEAGWEAEVPEGFIVC